MFCCGVDVGYRNCSFCIINSVNNEIVYLRNVNLFSEEIDGRIVVYEFDPKLIPLMIEKFVRENETDYFSKCKLFCVENQIQVKMFRVQFGLEALFSRYGRAITIHPNSVKKHFGTRKGEYAENKRAAVQWCLNNLEGINLARFKEYEADKKCDDLADAIMLAKYGIDHKEELTTVVFKEEGIDKKKKKRKRRRKK